MGENNDGSEALKNRAQSGGLHCGGFAAYSFIKRTPVSVGLVRGIRRLALPIVAALTVAYAVVICLTLRAENAANRTLRQCILHGENSYYINLLNQGKVDGIK